MKAGNVAPDAAKATFIAHPAGTDRWLTGWEDEPVTTPERRP